MEAVDYIPRLVEAGLNSDRRSLESISLTISRKLKKTRPDVSEGIAHVLATNGAAAPMRFAASTKLPVDRETRYSLVEVEEPAEIEDPILSAADMKQLEDFIKERGLLERFYSDDIEPSNSILFTGRPGVGKTYTAHWIAFRLGLPLISLDLATSISSYLGRSGQNIKSVFGFAKEQPTVLFLDEFDAIAKRRDDAGDLGELKRLVNVLLKEIEDCPKSSVILAATNHPELLDRAMWRRFDRVMELALPDEETRYRLLERHLPASRYPIGAEVRAYLVSQCKGVSAAEICKLCEQIKRQQVLSPEEYLDVTALRELTMKIGPRTKEQRSETCRLLKSCRPSLTTRGIAQIIGVSASTVSRCLKDGTK